MNRLLALALVFAASPACAGVIEGRVIEVSAGATVTILSRGGASMRRVRLAGVAAPARRAKRRIRRHRRQSLVDESPWQ